MLFHSTLWSCHRCCHHHFRHHRCCHHRCYRQYFPKPPSQPPPSFEGSLEVPPCRTGWSLQSREAPSLAWWTAISWLLRAVDQSLPWVLPYSSVMWSRLCETIVRMGGKSCIEGLWSSEVFNFCCLWSSNVKSSIQFALSLGYRLSVNAPLERENRREIFYQWVDLLDVCPQKKKKQ